MKAVIQESYGGADTLELREVPVPSPRRGEVLVRVRAAGIDRGTWHLMAGLPLVMRLGFGLRGPGSRPRSRPRRHRRGGGRGSHPFREGDAVYGTGHGSLAEFARAREDRLAAKPVSLSFEQAAAVPVSAHRPAGTPQRRPGCARAVGPRHRRLRRRGHVCRAARQGVRGRGDVVCSTTKVDLVRSLGADHVIDYTRSDLDDGARQYDLVLDIAGNRPAARLRRLLTPTGTLVIVGGEEAIGGRGMQRQLGAVALSPLVRHRLAMMLSRENSADLVTLADLADQGLSDPRSTAPSPSTRPRRPCTTWRPATRAARWSCR